MNREKFLERYESPSTVKNYVKAFKKLDSWLDKKNLIESQLIQTLKVSEVHLKYHILQEIIDHIKESVSSSVCRNYFESIFVYLLLQGSPLDYTEKRIRLKFPRISISKLEGLDENMIKEILKIKMSDNFKAYITLLLGGGLRETEALKVTPSMFRFDEYPTRLLLPKEITKFNIARETFCPPLVSERIKQIIKTKSIKPDQTIFVDQWHEDSLIGFEIYFANIRTKAKLDTPNRKPYQQNDITLHSFRSYFITIFTDNDLESFAYALTGHKKYLATYYRKSLEGRRQKYSISQNELNY
jgi:integrase